MNPITRHYIKVFLITGFGFSILMLLFDFLSGDGFSLVSFLLRAVLFGGFMSLLMVTSQVKQLKKQGIEKITADHLEVRQTRTVQSDVDRDSLIHKIKLDPVLNQMVMTEADNQINLKSTTSWWTWGENISIKMNQIGPDLFQYEISSRPKLKTTMADNAQNFINVIRIEKLINTSS